MLPNSSPRLLHGRGQIHVKADDVRGDLEQLKVQIASHKAQIRLPTPQFRFRSRNWTNLRNMLVQLLVSLLRSRSPIRFRKIGMMLAKRSANDLIRHRLWHISGNWTSNLNKYLVL